MANIIFIFIIYSFFSYLKKESAKTRANDRQLLNRLDDKELKAKERGLKEANRKALIDEDYRASERVVSENIKKESRDPKKTSKNKKKLKKDLVRGIIMQEVLDKPKSLR